MQNIIKLGIHHTGGLGNDIYASTSFLTASQIENAHRERNFNISALGFHTGYNVLIFPDGSWKQTRLIGEQTAAVKGHNFDGAYICLVGNFNRKPNGQFVDVPTVQQVNMLKNMMIAIVERSPESLGLKVQPNTVINIREIGPHRRWADTDCYGSGLADNWARDLVSEYFVEQINILKAIIAALLKSYGKLAGRRKVGDCLDNAQG